MFPTHRFPWGLFGFGSGLNRFFGVIANRVNRYNRYLATGLISENPIDRLSPLEEDRVDTILKPESASPKWELSFDRPSGIYPGGISFLTKKFLSGIPDGLINDGQL